MKIYFMTFEEQGYLKSTTYPAIKEHLECFDPDVVVRPIGSDGLCLVATTLNFELLSRIACVNYVHDVTYSVEQLSKLINSSHPHPEDKA